MVRLDVKGGRVIRLRVNVNLKISENPTNRYMTFVFDLLTSLLLLYVKALLLRIYRGYCLSGHIGTSARSV